jgi:hypothetical protein
MECERYFTCVSGIRKNKENYIDVCPDSREERGHENIKSCTLGSIRHELKEMLVFYVYNKQLLVLYADQKRTSLLSNSAFI